mmetsp:Transcript_13755/g.23450  ORF Transcript_13755/g.23450 Transcript_13755/m.23450 type:complete len:213 (-) Transcript_13755:448-1086(-)
MFTAKPRLKSLLPRWRVLLLNLLRRLLLLLLLLLTLKFLRLLHAIRFHARDGGHIALLLLVLHLGGARNKGVVMDRVHQAARVLSVAVERVEQHTERILEHLPWRLLMMLHAVVRLSVNRLATHQIGEIMHVLRVRHRGQDCWHTVLVVACRCHIVCRTESGHGLHVPASMTLVVVRLVLGIHVVALSPAHVSMALHALHAHVIIEFGGESP